MPFYEYQCSTCGHHLEALQKISDAPLKKCPDCGKSTLKRLISAPVFRLKGSGWYETDFKSDQENKRNLHGREEAPAETKAEAKTEAKADAGAKAESKAEPVAKTEPKKTEVAKPAAKTTSKPAKKPAAKPVAKKKARR